MVCIYIFRRDFRLKDNTTLNKINDTILPIFIFNPKQIKNSDYKSSHAINFMVEALETLQNEISTKGGEMTFYYGDDVKVLSDLLMKVPNITKIAFNKDFTNYAKSRDASIAKFCKKNNIQCEYHEDYTLLPINDVIPVNGGFYEVYTPYSKKCLKLLDDTNFSISHPRITWLNVKINSKYMIKTPNEFFTPGLQTIVHGDEKSIKTILTSLKNFGNYDVSRDFPYKNTSHLSAYLKFGCMSVREVYNKLKSVHSPEHGLIKQLLWKDFFYQLMHHLDAKYTIGGGNYKQLNLEWSNNKEHFENWCNGNTGFPFIDAGMRQLNTQGWMHNRPRMACANFLSMILHVDWKKGEKYFATQLVDYDISSNNGNWQWNAGVGVDRSPYLRVFNPWLQSSKHDKNCDYIKQWIPELQNVENKHIHKWYEYCKEYPTVNYMCPIVEYTKMKEKALKIYKLN